MFRRAVLIVSVMLFLGVVVALRGALAGPAEVPSSLFTGRPAATRVPAATVAPTHVPLAQPPPTAASRPQPTPPPQPRASVASPANTLLDGQPAAAELHAFPLPPAAQASASDESHFLTFKDSDSIDTMAAWLSQRLSSDGYVVRTDPMPDGAPLRSLTFTTPSARSGSIVVRPAESGGTGSDVLVVIR